MGKDLKNLEQLFYNSVQTYCHDSFESEFGFAFPVDAEKAFVYDDSQTVFKLKNGRLHDKCHGWIRTHI